MKNHELTSSSSWEVDFVSAPHDAFNSSNVTTITAKFLLSCLVKISYQVISHPINLLRQRRGIKSTPCL